MTGTGGARETDPREWWSALRTALAATGRAGEVGAIAVAGQQHGLVVLDNRGSPLRGAILWNDTRSAEDAERLTEPARGGDLGELDRAPAGRLVHRLQVGLAAADRARARPDGRCHPAPA